MTLSTVDFYLCPESTFGTDPDATGAAYLAAQIRGKPFYSNDKKVVPSKYATGRNRETASLIGPDGASENVDFALISNSAVASDGIAPPTADWLDGLFTAALGAATSKSGKGIAPSGTTTNLILDTDAFDVEDLACVNFSTRSEWRSIAADLGAGSYTLTPALTAAPDATKDALGYRYWTYTDTPGAAVTAYTELGGNGYRLSGGRPTLKIRMDAGAEEIKVTAGFKFDSKTRETKSNLPAVSKFTNTPMKAVLSPVLWGTATTIACKMVEIDFGIAQLDIGSTAATNGRASIDNVAALPKVTIETAFSTSLEDDFDAGTERLLLIQLGSGVLGGGRGNTLCFFAQSAQIISIQPADDSNYLRHKITFQVTDAGIRTGTTPYRYWILARS